MKSELLALVDHAVAQGWSIGQACSVLRLQRRRYERWRDRAALGDLEDHQPGGFPVHGLLDAERAEILAVFDQWADTDRSHRKLAHRGSYEGRFWASPATVRRVLHEEDKHFRPRPRPSRSAKRPIPAWVSYQPRQVWIYDTTHFTRAQMAVLAIMDLVSRKWITEVVSSEETSTQVEVGFDQALEREGLLDVLAQRDAAQAAGQHGPDLPILLAMSDNGPQMRSNDTREYMAVCSIAQHFGRPGTPTDQAWVESLFGHVKGEYPWLTQIRDPQTLRLELAKVREHYNTIRLHEAIGYVTPDDEHEGHGEAIRQARIAGMNQARARRIATRRQDRKTGPNEPGTDA